MAVKPFDRSVVAAGLALFALFCFNMLRMAFGG